ncbi:AMP-binding protein [Brevibacterium yomogidense]|uniref:Probable long-chain-fatty-acid--CoA ligase n=1 Tax=Brevibacterium yomogidense TaxID=946573 RepID=A0A1X6XP62_9MICO|nr:AMP-binding protein [Brevibacterium yomogidense]SLN00928.1 probable long-chain-fatty-acid--CoA ligase [Brevibacterium yomogidense]
MTIELELSRTHLPVASLFRHARELPNRLALVDSTTSVTYGELLLRVQVVAARLHAAGVRPDDRVAVVAGNCAAFPVVVLATNYLGAIIVPVNFRLAAGEIAYILGNCEPTVVVTDAERADVTRDAIGDAPLTMFDLTELAGPGPIGASESVPDPMIRSLTDDQAIIYTSGTTGRPKGAVLSYSSVLSTTMRSSVSGQYRPGQEVGLLASPMFHIAAFNAIDTNLANAATTVITPSTGFDAANILDLMEEHGITVTFMVPSQWQLMVDEQRRRPRDIKLGFYGWGAAPATEALLTALREVFPEAGSQAAFGQTETSGGGVSLSHEDSLRKLGSVGKPDRNFSIRVVDPEMNDVPHGEVGEIVYQGPGLMSRYWNNPKATAEAFHGGWFHSGDLVRQDEEGFLYVVDRVKDMIISGGENIYCAELENVVAWHPKVAEVAVVGRRDEKWGEIPVAVVVPRNEEELPSLEEIREFCDGKLARYKLPKDVVIREGFPRSGTGKIQKTVLRQKV